MFRKGHKNTDRKDLRKTIKTKICDLNCDFKMQISK